MWYLLVSIHDLCTLTYFSNSLELDTTLATMVQQSSNRLTSQIIRHPAVNSLFHSDFDNFDKFTATGSVHTAHEIMLQDVDQKDGEAVELDTPTIKGTEQRSLDVVFDSQELSECYVTQRKSSLHAVTIGLAKQVMNFHGSKSNYHYLLYIPVSSIINIG